ncbi:unnamed protein product [Effrenium voratum]|nr:unnamed protein product [Effrenium voratum]
MGQAVSINVSLHWLEGVINALNRKGSVVPYRNSFLTKVLKDALGGNAKSIMVATLNPSETALPETISTCRFAQRVANVQTFSRINEERDPQLVIAALRQENAELRAALGAHGEALPEEELRRRARTFMEEDAAPLEASIFSVASLLEAFSVFRMLKELCWEMLRKKLASPSSRSQATEVPKSPTSEGTDSVELKQVLSEREAECRTLRAALAAQQPRPAPRPVRPARARSVSTATQTEAGDVPRRRRRRPASAGDTRRGDKGRGFVNFSQEDVVDPFGRMEGKTTLPPLVPRDARVPDFRQMQGSESSAPKLGTTSKESVGASAEATSKPAGGVAAPPAAPVAVAAPAPQAPQAPAGGASAAWLAATTALTEEERQLMVDPAKAYQLFLLHDPRAADIWPSELQDMRQADPKLEIRSAAQ